MQTNIPYSLLQIRKIPVQFRKNRHIVYKENMSRWHKYISIRNIFIAALILSTAISAYIFVDRLMLKSTTHIDLFNTWQFPMLLALTLDVLHAE